MNRKNKDDILQLLSEHWMLGWPQSLDFDDGWNNHVYDGALKLISIDREIKFEQIKEKFGLLRIYCTPSNKDIERKVRFLCGDIEKASAHICERTGGFGQLMRRNGVYKTLSLSFIDEGWTPFGDPPFTNFIGQP